jgi:hypothetical protein
MRVGGQHYNLAALPAEERSDIPFLGGWVDPRVCLGVRTPIQKSLHNNRIQCVFCSISKDWLAFTNQYRYVLQRRSTNGSSHIPYSEFIVQIPVT